jgi:GTP-binding protein
VSGATGEGIDALMSAIFAVHETWNIRIATGRLNRWLSAALAANPPPAVSGRRIKIRYMTQLRARPPYFVIFGNQLEHLPESYKRFLTNGIRETFNLKGVPIRLSVRTSENPYDKKGRG